MNKPSLRDRRIANITRYLQGHGPTLGVDISRALGINRTAIYRLLDECKEFRQIDERYWTCDGAADRQPDVEDVPEGSPWWRYLG